MKVGDKVYCYKYCFIKASGGGQFLSLKSGKRYKFVESCYCKFAIVDESKNEHHMSEDFAKNFVKLERLYKLEKINKNDKV
jgi:hypothetical protein